MKKDNKGKIGNRVDQFRKKKKQLNLFFILQIAMTTVLIVALSGVSGFFLARIFHTKNVEYAPIMLFFIWVAVSVTVSHFFLYKKLKRVFDAVQMINDATEKVAAGDFTVRVQLDEHVQIE
ncbi:MAG: hypothetical protein IKN79_11620, partial [Eubacterium sp.]|nr:hypothetical protein [Eubacterium sp.]